MISPRDGAELLSGGQTLDVAVTVRVPEIAPGDRVRLQVDDGAAADLNLAGSTATTYSAPLSARSNTVLAT